MSRFSYKAYAKTGKQIEGVMEATAERDVLILLRKQNLKVLRIEKMATPWPEIFAGLTRKKVGAQDVMRFTSMFSTLVNAGIPLSACLRTLQEQTDHPELKNVLSTVIQEIESGLDLSTALSKHPDVFNAMYVDLVRAGEAGGALHVVLERLAIYSEKTERLRRKIKGALTYPIVVVCIACLIVGVILIFVVPEFAQTFAAAGKVLPLPTRILLMVSDAVRHLYLFIIIAGGGLYAGFRFAIQNPQFQKTADVLMLKLPLFGDLLMKSAVSRFARTLAMLLVSGVSIIQSLQIVAHVTGNKVIAEALLNVGDAICSGESFAEPMKRCGVFSPLVVQMIAVGESTGNMAGMLSKVADFYEDEVETAAESLSSLIEPLMIVFLGIVLGFVIIALFLPILSLSEVIPL